MDKYTREIKFKKILAIICAFVILIGFTPDSFSVSANYEEDETVEDFEENLDSVVSENGYLEINGEYENTYDASLFEDETIYSEGFQSRLSTFSTSISTITKIGYYKEYFSDASVNVYQSSTGNNVISYITSDQYYSGMFPIIEESTSRFKIVISGVTGWVDKEGIISNVFTQDSTVNVYYRSGTDFYHRIFENSEPNTKNENGTYYTLKVGKAPDYIKERTNYYSFDGHNFYSNFTQMYKDYQNNTRSNSVNYQDEYYNYYQFLPYRSSSNYTAEDLNNFLNQKRNHDKESVLVDKGSSFINNGAYYGSNPTLSFLLSVQESGWGTSHLSLERFNIFGHNAADTYPAGANRYTSVNEAIKVHVDKFMNWTYLCKDSVCNYRGGAVGDKANGINVKYSSDPYWGEKIAGLYYALDDAMGGKDYGKYTVGITTDQIRIRRDATTQSTEILQIAEGSPLIISETVKGQSFVSGNENWYKIINDLVLDSNRNVYDCEKCSYREISVNLNTNYSFAYSEYVKIVHTAKDVEVPPVTVYKRGDANKDGKIDVLDMMVIRRHVLGTKSIPSNEYNVSDVNQDGKVDVLDMMAIRRHILGTKPIE